MLCLKRHLHNGAANGKVGGRLATPGRCQLFNRILSFRKCRSHVCFIIRYRITCILSHWSHTLVVLTFTSTIYNFSPELSFSGLAFWCFRPISVVPNLKTEHVCGTSYRDFRWNTRISLIVSVPALILLLSSQKKTDCRITIVYDPRRRSDVAAAFSDETLSLPALQKVIWTCLFCYLLALK